MSKSMLPFGLFALAVLLHGCVQKETIVETTPVGDPFEIRADQYSLSHYFVDTSYMSLYEPFYQSMGSPVVDPQARIYDCEVWVQRQDSSFSSSDRFGVAWMSLPARPSAGYDSSYRLAPETLGTVEAARFQLMDPSWYRLEGEGYVGVVSFSPFSDPVPDITFGIAYRRGDGSQYGDFVRDTPNNNTPLVLKLVKPRNLFINGPRYRVAWQMLLKNNYCIRPGRLVTYGFQLAIFRSDPSNGYDANLQGHALLNVLGLDRFAADCTPRPEGDGQFDFRPGMTVNKDFGEIIFPSLRPFDTGIKRYFVEHGLPLPDSTYFCPEIYDATQAVARQSAGNRYSIQGRAIFD